MQRKSPQTLQIARSALRETYAEIPGNPRKSPGNLPRKSPQVQFAVVSNLISEHAHFGLHLVPITNKTEVRCTCQAYSWRLQCKARVKTDQHCGPSDMATSNFGKHNSNANVRYSFDRLSIVLIYALKETLVLVQFMCKES